MNRELLARLNAATELAVKVRNHSGQFVKEPGYREWLIRRGLEEVHSMLGGNYRPSLLEAEKRMRREIACAVEENGVIHLFFAGTHIVGSVFPDNTKLFYENDTLALPNSQPSRDYVLAPPTNKGGLPEEGLQVGDLIVTPFKERLPESRIQHGGIIMNNTTGAVQLLEYSDFHSERGALQIEELAFEANWFMTSDTAEQVATRPNMIRTRPYNILGEMATPSGPRMFTVCNFDESCRNLAENLRLDNPDKTPHMHASVAELAVASTLLAQMFGTSQWKAAGLEFNNGGLYYPDFQMPHQTFDRFIVSTPTPSLQN